MPHDEPHVEDPLELSAFGSPDPDGESTRQMAACFAEEFLRLGYEPGHVLSLFEYPRYALAHRALLTLGFDAIRAIVDEQARIWSPSMRTAART